MKLQHAPEYYIVPILILLAIIGAGIAYQNTVWVDLDMGAPTIDAYIEGFHEVEEAGAFSYRWSKERAQVHLSGIGRGRPTRLQLTMARGLDPNEQPITVTVRADDQVLGHVLAVPLPSGRAGPHTYTLHVPPQFSFSGDLVVQLEAPPLQTAGDPRQLSLAVSRVTASQGRTLALPPIQPTLLLAAVIVLAYTAVRLAGWDKLVALIGSIGLLLPLTILLATMRLWVAPYLPGFAGAVTITALLLFLVRTIVPSTDLTLPHIFIALAILAPLFLWWQFTLLPIDPDERHFLPIVFPLIAAILYLGTLLWPHRGEKAPRSSARLPARTFSLIVLGLSLAYAALFYLRVFAKDYATDFHALFDGVRQFYNAGGSLYDLEAIRQNHLGDVYKYPPFFSLVLLPLAKVPFVPALQTWRAINLLLLALSALVIARAYRFRNHYWLWAGLLLILCNWRPIGDTIAYGQVDILLLLPIAGTVAALRHKRDGLAGFLLSLATMLKLYPAFLALFFLVRRQWRALIAFSTSLLLLAGLSIVALGWPIHATYLQEVVLHTGGGTPWIENQTLNGFFNRLLTDRIALTPETNRWADLAALAASATMILATLWLIYRSANRDRPHEKRPAKGSRSLRGDLGLGLLIVTMLLVLPAAWIHYETLLVLPLVLVFVYGREHHTVPLKIIAPIGFAFGLLCFGNAWSVFLRTVYGRFWQLLLSYKLYGMAFLWIGLALLLDHRPATPPQPTPPGRTSPPQPD